MHGMKRVFLGLAVILIIAFYAWQWRAKPETRWQVIAPGVEMKMLSVGEGSAFNGATKIIALRTTPSRIKILKGETRNAVAWRQDEKSLAIINGGFFDPQGKTLGLRVSDGEKKGGLHDADWGVFFIRKGKAGVLHTREFKRQYTSLRNISQAVQCGPRLVVDGQTTDLKPQTARRTGVGIQRDGRIIIAVSEGALAFDDWANLWAASDGLNCRDALNLDGGGSTQISLKTKKKSLEVSGLWPVPDVIAIH